MPDDFHLEPPPNDPESRAKRRREMERKAIVIRGENTLFNAASWQLFLDWVEEGRSIEDIDQSDLLPSWSTLRRWMRGNDELLKQYRDARDFSADAFEGKIVHLLEQELDKGEVPAARLKFDVVKHLTATRSPKRYGTKSSHEVSGPDGGSIPITEIRRVIIRNGDTANTDS